MLSALLGMHGYLATAAGYLTAWMIETEMEKIRLVDGKKALYNNEKRGRMRPGLQKERADGNQKR